MERMLGDSGKRVTRLAAARRTRKPCECMAGFSGHAGHSGVLIDTIALQVAPLPQLFVWRSGL
jgi:hypothetical protein